MATPKHNPQDERQNRKISNRTSRTLIVGLGNPGPTYARTRHNLGWRVLDELVQREAAAWSAWKRERDIIFATGAYPGARLVALKPQTFMNESGGPVARFVKFYQLPLAQVWIVHDDVDLPLGELREALDRGAAGHKGVESIIRSLGSRAFHRLRLGVGSNRDHNLPAEDYVLQDFTAEEEQRLAKSDGIIAQACARLIAELTTKK